MLSVQRREPNDESKTIAATDRHDFHQCRSAGRLDDKQGGDTIVTMESVREAINFNAELKDKSRWLWLTSEQMGFPLRQAVGGEHEGRAEGSDSSRSARGHLVAHHLAPAITDFISDVNQKCCNNDLEQTVKRSSPRGKVQHIIHLLPATQLTRKVRSSCVEACGGKRPPSGNYTYKIMSFNLHLYIYKPFNDIIMIVSKFLIALRCLRSYST